MRFTFVLALACAFLVAGSFAAGNPQNGAGDPQANAASVLTGTPVVPNTSPPVTIGSEPDATLDLSGGSVAIGVGYVWGSGDVLYKGQKHETGTRGHSSPPTF